MYRSQQKKIKVNFLFNNGGIGDLVGSLPALVYIHKNHPHVDMHIWIGNFGVEFVQRCLPKSDRVHVYPFKDIASYDQNSYTKCIGYGSTYTNFASHITKHAFSMLVNVEPEAEDLNYPQMDQSYIKLDQFNLPEKYVVLNVGHTSGVREWLPAYVTEVARYIKNKGYMPVFMGKSQSDNGAGYIIKGNVNAGVDFSLGIDLRDKTTLPEAQVIISRSRGIVGLDNGLLHVAATSDVPIVGGFTTVKPMHRMPYRKGILGWNYHPIVLSAEQLKCSGCQSNLAFTVNHRFDGCLYDDRRCLQLLSPDLYIENLDKIL